MHRALELTDLPQNAAVAIYGNGSMGQKTLFLLKAHRPDIRVLCFMDSFASSTSQDIPCWKFSETPEEILLQLDIIILASTFRFEMLGNISSLTTGKYGISVRFVHPEFPFGIDARDYSMGTLERWKARGRVPTSLSVSFTENCNFRCKMCMAAKRGMLKDNYLNRKVFLRVIEQYHEAKLARLGLNGQGESLLHPEFLDFVSLAYNEGIKMVIVTNGSLLTEKMAAQLHKKNVHIKMSFTGWDKNSYESQYIGGKFDHVENMIRFMAREFPSSAFTIKCCMLEDAAEDRAKIQAFLNERGVSPESYRISEASSQGGYLQFGEYSEGKDIYSFKPSLNQKPQPLCARLLNSWSMFSNGLVSACGCGPAIKEYVLGNIMEQSLEEMGKSPLLSTVVDSFMDPDKMPKGRCRRCEQPMHPSFVSPMIDITY